MISARELDGILASLTTYKANVFRYKNGEEEMEIVIPGESTVIDEKETTGRNSPAGPKIKLIGFQSDPEDDNDED